MRDRLIAQAESRWRTIVDEQPDLEPAVRLQRRLLTRVIDASARIDAGRLPRLSLPPRYIEAKLARGVPALRGEPLPLPVSVLVPLLEPLCEDLARGGAGEAATHIQEALASGRLEGGSLLAASLARDQDGIRRTSMHHGLAPDLLWLIGELAAGPFVHALNRSLWRGRRQADDHEPPDRRDGACASIGDWGRGYCPTCGSWPALAEIIGSRRTLRCSFCAGSWSPAVHCCVYCGESGQAFSAAAADPSRVDRLLELCADCGGYLKILSLSAPSEFPLLAIEDLASLDLDRAAMARGFARPPLPALTRGESL